MSPKRAWYTAHKSPRNGRNNQFSINGGTRFSSEYRVAEENRDSDALFVVPREKLRNETGACIRDARKKPSASRWAVTVILSDHCLI